MVSMVCTQSVRSSSCRFLPDQIFSRDWPPALGLIRRRCSSRLASRTPLSAATQTRRLGTSYQDCINLRLSPFTWLLPMCLGIQPGLSMPISSSTSSFAGLASLFPQPLWESLLLC
jgi:hypothetical protein